MRQKTTSKQQSGDKMFEFFIALFGGAHYGGKLFAERIEHEEAKRCQSDARARKDRWCSKVIDQELEKELRLFISRPENRESILEQVSKAYDKILDDVRIDELYPRQLWCKKEKGWSDEQHEAVQSLLCKLNPENALRIIMAKHGKFPYLDAITGAAKQFNPHTKLDAQVLIWCADELRRHGVEEEFYVPNLLIGFGQGGEYMGWII